MRRVSLCLIALTVGACSQESNVNRLEEAPIAKVIAPNYGDVFRHGEGMLSLLGEVSDSYDVAEDLQVAWQLDEDQSIDVSADADGQVAHDLSIDLLAPGHYTATLQVTDTDGQIGTALAEWDVFGPAGAPTVQILSPADGTWFDPGEAITFQGEAWDLTTPAEELRFRWASDVDGELEGAVSADGRSLVVATLSDGTHVVTLEAVDTEGEVGQAVVVVDVGVEPTEIEEPQDAQPGDLVFSEMMINPELVWDEVGEWVELYNTASYPIDVSGYSFRDDDFDEFVLEGPLVVQGGEFMVLCADLDPAVNGGVACDGWFLRDWEGNGLALANREDEVVLTRPDGEEIDWLHYDEDWFTPGIAIGISPEHMTSGDNDDPNHWCDQYSVMASGETGTPGRENDACN